MEFNASSASYESRSDLFEKIIVNMKIQRGGNTKTGILLAGDPGTGKTSAIRFFAELVGIELITIEAPHITEEHIINIPFFVFNPVTKTQVPGDTNISDESDEDKSGDYKIVLSDSNLFTQINKSKKIPDALYLKNIYAGPEDLIKIFESFGGDEKTIPPAIIKIRTNTTVILFLDEYFRQTSMRIRNMLRGILNGKIGSHDIPKEAYVIFASNMTGSSSEGIEDIPTNQEFATVHFKAPNKDDWFAWLVAKFKKDERVKLNDKVLNEFYTLLEEEDLNNADMATEVMTSPRRWEQILLYINSSLPVKDEDDARALLTNIKLNFKNYLTGEHAALAKKVLKATAKLIKETSDDKVEIGEDDVLGDTKWRNTLEHQLKVKMSLGEHRKYVPIISGAPGIGKTFHAAQVAADLKLRYIYIDCSTLDPEDTQGIPLAKTKKDKSIETSFSVPKLYNQILNDAKKQDAAYTSLLKEKGDKESLKLVKEYSKKEWKYLIFFDELNRTSKKVFNGIRKVLLEKNFGSNLHLPDGSIVMGAINPTDIGTNELTQHMKDIVDVVDAHGSWASTKKFIGGMKFDDLTNNSSRDIVEKAIFTFIDKFKTRNEKIASDKRHFYLDVGATPAYISPREIVTIYSTAVEMFDSKTFRLIKNNDLSKLKPEQLKELENKLRLSVFDSIKSTLDTIFLKHSISAPEFEHDLKTWMLNTEDIPFGEALFYKKAKTRDFSEIVKPYFDDTESDLTEEQDFINYINNVDAGDFRIDLTDFIMSVIDKDGDILKHVGESKIPKKILDNKKQLKTIEKEMVSRMEHFIHSLVHSFIIHDLPNEKREMMHTAIKNVTSSLQHSIKSDAAAEEKNNNELQKFSDEIEQLRKSKSITAAEADKRRLEFEKKLHQKDVHYEKQGILSDFYMKTREFLKTIK